MDFKEIEEKFSKILNGFLNENFEVVNDVYLEMLLSHLSGKNGKDYSEILQSPLILEWLESCFDILQKDFKKLNPQVTAFMLKLCALLADNEWAIINVRDRRFADRIHDLLEKNHKIATPAIKLGHIQFLKQVSTKTLGVGWIKNMKAWKPVVEYCQQNQTIYVYRESKEFLSQILYKLSLYSEKTQNEECVLEILTEIMKPINENVYAEELSINSIKVKVDDFDLQRKLTPTLCLLSHILQKTLDYESKTKISYYLDSHFNLNKNLWKLADMTQNEQFLRNILDVLTSSNYSKLLYEKWNGVCNVKIASEDFNEFGVYFFNLFKFCISRKSYYNVIYMVELNHILWKKLGDRVPEEVLIENERIQFENQILTFHLMPVLFVLRSRILKCEELFDNYLMKLFTISCEFTLRICYAFRDLLLECKESSGDLASKSIHGIISMENVLNQDRAVLVFEAMAYALKEFTPEYNSNKESDPLIQIPNVLYAVLVGLQTLIRKYRITWKESIHTICLVNFMLALLSNQNLSSRLAVQALKLTQLSIEHFLSPNLALLVENFNGSGMQNLAPMIVKRLHDNAWEVRDSTLELVTSIAYISQLKFPAFQQNMLDNGICPIVFSMAKNDSEPYVRASALKCLSQMVVINLLWEQSLNSTDIVDHLLTSLCIETEGIVRKEAVLLLTKIYDNRKFAPEKMNCLYSTLTHCTVNDLHWEVKINALHFWRIFIRRQFTNQGMIDGIFPTVTFSKEKKKIVTLTEKEILLRIHKILNDLSDHGLLGILLECLNDDCDLEVVKAAVYIIKKLSLCLDTYDYVRQMNSITTATETSKNYDNNQSSSSSSLSTTTLLSKMENQNNLNENSSIINTKSSKNNDDNEENLNSENIIESIINSNDINLLSMAYKNQMQVECSRGTCQVDENLFKKYSKIKPKDYIMKIKLLNVDQIVEKRSEWIMSTESLNSLLDDMLFYIKTLEVNDADCY